MNIIYEFAKHLGCDKKLNEEIYVECFTNGIPNAVFQAGMGNDHEYVVNVKTILTTALLTGAQKVILWHNHPDGNLEPSPKDISFL